MARAVRRVCPRGAVRRRADPRVACIYARRALEHVVTHIYDVARLPIPYKDDLSAKVDAADFRNLTGQGIATKMNLVRKLGNAAAHDSRTIPPHAAMQVLRELHHVVYWTAFHYYTDPTRLPSAVAFDPTVCRASSGTLPVSPPVGTPTRR